MKSLKVTEKKLKKYIEGAKLSELYRDGKELHLVFDNGHVLGLHLMLKGGLHLFKDKNNGKSIEVLFTDGTGLAMADFQGQATPILDPEPREAEDALSEKINFTFLEDKMGKSRAAIKNILLDQKVIRGIGSAYADEILWQAHISPFSAANKIPDPQLSALAKAIRSVLAKAEKLIIKNYPDIISGEVRDFMNVHNAKRSRSPTGAKIEVKKSGARKTYYTDEQVLY